MRRNRYVRTLCGNSTTQLNFNHQMQAPAPTPIFGSAATFGTSTGFGGFIGLATKAEGEGEEEGGDDEAPEEECKAEFKPIVQLEEVDVSTGEEDEECLMDLYVYSFSP